MPDLSDADSLLLASSFDLSGRQIDNMVRKIEIEGILNASPIGLTIQ